MAGDWLKIEIATPDKPEISLIAEDLGVSTEEAFMVCFRVWRWFDQHTLDGNAPGVTKKLLDRFAFVTGACNSLEKVGWLRVHNDHIELPNFDRHNGQTAKRRALTSKRVANFRMKKCNAPGVTKTLPEKRREEKKENTPLLSPQGDMKEKPVERKPNILWDAVCEIWGLKPVTKTENKELGRIVSDLKAKGATPAEIRIRLARYRRQWPDAADTPRALVKHWDRFAVDRPASNLESDFAELEAARERMGIKR